MSVGIENNIYGSKYNTQIRSKTKKDATQKIEKSSVENNKQINPENSIDEQFEEFKNNFTGEDVLPDNYQILNSLNSLVKSNVIIDPGILKKINSPEMSEKLKNLMNDLPEID